MMIFPQRRLTPKALSLALSLVTTLAGTTFTVTAKARSLALQNPPPVAKAITFGKNPIDLAVGARKTVEAVVSDEAGKPIVGAQVEWRLADPEHRAFVFLGTPVNDKKASIEIVGLDNQAEPKAPSQVPLIAKCGDVWSVLTINYIASTKSETSLTVTPNVIVVRPGEAAQFKVAVTATDQGKKTELPKFSIKTELSSDANAFLAVTSSDDEKTVTVTGKYATDPKKPVPEIMSLIVRAAGASNVVAVRYIFDSVKVIWDVVPPNIVGDNYGRTIKHDYYCIEVTIQNFSGEDMALAAMAFDLGDQSNLRPNTSYSTVHGSLARRKLTHPRTLTLAVMSAAGQLLTGFNPFFHNETHGLNFSHFIDILSNPLEKGTALVWPDSYPDEVARFEQDILRDDKVIPSGSVFKTKIFFPKRALFQGSADGDKNNLDDIREALGNLVIFGYKFHRGPLQTVTDTPATRTEPRPPAP